MLKNKCNQLYRNVKGFTLMEVMVAVSIFTIIVTVGIGALLTINNTHRKSQQDRAVIDSIHFALESMSRSIRTAKQWGTISTGNPSEFYFTDQNDSQINYRHDSTMRAIIMDISDSTTVPDGSYPVTPESIRIEEVVFEQFGGPGTGVQSYLQIQIRGAISSPRQQTDFSIQTGVSKRLLDVL
jgi:prepilin-type N-terminal cleavage/methylation domain-containing protein